jgi:putative FmdB family regulatory protein
MPWYRYTCKKCKKDFDHYAGMLEKRLETCLKCGESRCLTRIPNWEGPMRFKGPGTHTRDYDKKEWK